MLFKVAANNLLNRRTETLLARLHLCETIFLLAIHSNCAGFFFKMSPIRHKQIDIDVYARFFMRHKKVIASFHSAMR